MSSGRRCVSLSRQQGLSTSGSEVLWRSSRMRAAARASALPAILCALALGIALWLWMRPGALKSVLTPACQPTETVTEVQFQDFGPTSVVITHPCGDNSTKPRVVFASYLSLVDADYYTGRDPVQALLTPRDSHHFLFGWLARELARQGYTSVRYDPIAIRSTKRAAGPAFVRSSVAQEDLLRVRRAHFSGLLAQVVSGADKVLGGDAATPIVFVGHSGGAFTVGDFLETARGSTSAEAGREYGFVGIAAAVSDATGIRHTHWRYWVKRAETCLPRFPKATCMDRITSDPMYRGVVGDAEVRRRVEEAFLQTEDRLVVVEKLDRELRQFALALERARSEGREGVSVLNGEYRFQTALWHELAFRSPSSRPLSCLSTAAALVYGKDDYLLDTSVETQAWTQACGREGDITIIPQLGHSLGPDPYYGPPDRAALDVVVQAITAVSARLAQTPLTRPSSNTPAPPSPSSSPPSTGTRR